MQAADRGFADLVTLTFPGADAIEARRGEAFLGFLELIGRAKDSGHLRADFVSEDLFVLLIANAGVIAATGDDASASGRRLVGHFLRAFLRAVANPGTPLPPMPPAPTSEALRRAMARFTQVPNDSGSA